MTTRNDISPVTRIHTLRVAMSRVDPTVFTLAATDTTPWGISEETLEDLLDDLLDELTYADGMDEPFGPDVIAMAVDLSDQAFQLVEDIECGEIQIPLGERYVIPLTMLSLALGEFDDVEGWAELHEDAASLGMAERIH